MNERDFKKAVRDGKICSVSGRPCKCDSGEGCTRSRRSSSLDTARVQALRWARTSELRLSQAIDDLDRALEGLTFERAHPAPEWREARRLIAAALTYLKDTNG